MLLELWLVSHITQVEVGVGTVEITEVLRLVFIHSQMYAVLHFKTLLFWFGLRVAFATKEDLDVPGRI